MQCLFILQLLHFFSEGSPQPTQLIQLYMLFSPFPHLALLARKSMSSLVCIRCGSRDHTTRDHDEGKVGKGLKPSSPKKTRPASSSANAAGSGSPREEKKTQVTHDRCFKTSLKSPGIPDILDPPFRERNYRDLPQTNWTCRENCHCKECEKKRLKKAQNAAKRQKVHSAAPSRN
jgi:hypothetical protein